MRPLFADAALPFRNKFWCRLLEYSCSSALFLRLPSFSATLPAFCCLPSWNRTWNSCFRHGAFTRPFYGRICQDGAYTPCAGAILFWIAGNKWNGTLEPAADERDFLAAILNRTLVLDITRTKGKQHRLPQLYRLMLGGLPWNSDSQNTAESRQPSRACRYCFWCIASLAWNRAR